MCKGSNNILYMQYPLSTFYNILEPKEVIMVVIIYALIYLASMICLEWPMQMPNYQGSPKAIDGLLYDHTIKPPTGK